MKKTHRLTGRIAQKLVASDSAGLTTVPWVTSKMLSLYCMHDVRRGRTSKVRVTQVEPSPSPAS